jgi:hypothetical protein
MVSVSNGAAYVNLMNATNQVYAVWGTTNLLNGWNVETNVWPTNSSLMPFTVQTLGRQNLFLQAEDWTGVTEGNNITPCWWFYYYFGADGLALSDTNLDSQGIELWEDYQAGIDPNIISFSINVTNPYCNTANVPIPINVTAGTPFFMTVMVDDTNAADAVWVPFGSNLVASVGAMQGWHNFNVGLRGLPTSSTQSWRTAKLDVLTAPPVVVITNPIPGIVTQPMIEVQGYCNEQLASLTYNLSNAAGLFTNQQVLILSQYADTNLMKLTTNMFQAFDVPLTNGDNVLTFYATDRVGNVGMTNFTFTLDYSGKTNPPVMQIYWPQNGDNVTGTDFTLRSSLDDFTASLTAQIIDSSGGTNTYQGLVERNGLYWVENVALPAGTTGSPDGTPGNPTAADSMAAQVQIDQPSVVVMQQYNYTYNVTSTYTGCPMHRIDIFTGSVNATYGNAGTANGYSYDSMDLGGNPIITWDNQDFSWPCDQCIVTDVETDQTGASNTFTTPLWNAVWTAQYYSMFGDTMPMAEWGVSGQGGYSMILDGCPDKEVDGGNESICTTMMLFTGGKGVRSIQNLFEIDVSATSYLPSSNPDIEDWMPIWDVESVPPGQIQDLGQTPNANGQIFIVLPDNMAIDVTPQAPPPCYTYSVGAIKYKSYFFVFVDQPDTTSPYHHVWTSADSAGHAWWRLELQAPAAALNHYIQSNLLSYLNISEGYGPLTDVKPWSPTAPGLLRLPETDVYFSVSKKYEIGFQDLINGLIFSQAIRIFPPEYDLYNNNCVDIDIKAGTSVGLSLPDDKGPKSYSNPEWFGYGINGHW